mmetsp:Transcript_33831/g.79733  ORF Transcript_33831/g.79733 Transcript_33831/m.79733 type:complete len:98 (+) Transcript_33831:689-982(+)
MPHSKEGTLSPLIMPNSALAKHSDTSGRFIFLQKSCKEVCTFHHRIGSQNLDRKWPNPGWIDWTLSVRSTQLKQYRPDVVTISMAPLQHVESVTCSE